MSLPVSIDERACIGHVHLKVSNLEQSVEFYTRALGFQLRQRIGSSAAFLSAGGYHHHLGLNTWESQGGSPPPLGTVGLFHFAILYPHRRALAVAVKRLLGSGVTLDGAADHGVSEAVYFRDPDGIGVELYCDRPESLWPKDKDGGLSMFTRELDLAGLIAEADGHNNLE